MSDVLISERVLERRLLCLLPGPLSTPKAAIPVERLAWITGAEVGRVASVLRHLEADGVTSWSERGWRRT